MSKGPISVLGFRKKQVLLRNVHDALMKRRSALIERLKIARISAEFSYRRLESICDKIDDLLDQVVFERGNIQKCLRGNTYRRKAIRYTGNEIVRYRKKAAWWKEGHCLTCKGVEETCRLSGCRYALLKDKSKFCTLPYTKRRITSLDCFNKKY